MDSLVTVRSQHLSAQIDPFGAQLSTLRDGDGRDLLWDGDPNVWAGRAPILFPIVGTLAGGSYRLGAQRYALSRHGFARGKTFATMTATPSSAVFSLSADDATRAVYPFEFELDVAFALAGPTLSVTATVRNTGTVALPASLGFHPGFRWPLPYGQSRSAHFVEFEVDEPAPMRRITSEGLLKPELQTTPVTRRRLVLDDALFQQDVVIFDQLRSRRLTYGAEEGPRIEIAFPDASYLGIWTRPGAPFICIEPWQGVTDPEGFADDLRRKPGIFTVAPGATRALHMTVTLRDSLR